MTWRAFETVYMSADSARSEMSSRRREGSRGRRARGRRRRREGRGVRREKGGNKDKDKIAEEGDADDAGEEDGPPRAPAVPPPHALPGLPRITNATLLVFHEVEPPRRRGSGGGGGATPHVEKKGKKKVGGDAAGGGRDAPPPPEPPKPPALSDRRAGGFRGRGASVRAAAGRPREGEPETTRARAREGEEVKEGRDRETWTLQRCALGGTFSASASLEKKNTPRCGIEGAPMV